MSKFKQNYILSLAVSLVVVFSCKEAESKNASKDSDTPNTEVSQVQKAQPLQNAQGEKIEVIYFAEGDQVAVRVKLINGTEVKLSAKGVNDKGNPLFTDGKYIWEMNEDGHSGKLTDEKGETKEYQ